MAWCGCAIVLSINFVTCMLRFIRLVLAAASLLLMTLLFLDFTGVLHSYLGWLARIQFLPALLALNFGVLVALVLVTLLFGRVYCSIICPLGILQDAISWLNSRRGRKQHLRFSYSPARTWLRASVLLLFMLSLIAGLGSVVALLAPYGTFGRIVSHVLAPLWALGNNALAYLAERVDSYAFYEVEVWQRSLPAFAVALGTLAVVGALAWRHGRAYCNTVCPVGTLLGMLSRVSLFTPRIDKGKCVSCGLCARQCKASCINPQEHSIDGSRCVACMNCLSACSKGAISYGLRFCKPADAPATTTPADPARRNFMLSTGMVLATAAAQQKEKLVDGGLAPLIPKEPTSRTLPVLPPGARSLRHFTTHCTGCQLCVAACPHGVLRPSASLERLMQPECSFERGFCHPECTRCSEVCPAGAILPLPAEEKFSTQIGQATRLRGACLAEKEGITCGACARHCPVGAITMMPRHPGDPASPEIPVVNPERCIGCGACEYYCPARPHSALAVNGHETHRSL